MPKTFEEWWSGLEISKLVESNNLPHIKQYALMAWNAGIENFKKTGPNCFDCKSKY